MNSFERFLGKMTRELLAASSEQLPRVAEETLSALCGHLGTDRAAFHHVEGEEIRLRYFWGDPELLPIPPSLAAFPWSTEELRAGRDLLLDRLPEVLPSEASAEGLFVERTGIRSLLCLPITVSGRFLWSIATSTYGRQIRWSSDDVERTRAVGGGLAAAAERVELEVALTERLAEVEKLKLRDEKRAREQLRSTLRRSQELSLEIEERHRAEGEAARLRREFEHVSRVTTAGELATSLAHEVNQPLAAIVSNAQAGRRFLAQGETGRAELEQILVDIARQGQRASEVIQRLREFLRKEPPSKEWIDLNELVVNVLPLVRREVEECEIELALDFPAALPKVPGDRVQLQQVAVNLIQNACDAMRTSPPPRRLVLRGRAEGGEVEFSVSDTGPGVPPAIAASMFEPFVSTKAGGMGVGLSICRSLVESHGGSLRYETTPEQGARFCMLLPTTLPAESPA